MDNLISQLKKTGNRQATCFEKAPAAQTLFATDLENIYELQLNDLFDDEDGLVEMHS